MAAQVIRQTCWRCHQQEPKHLVKRALSSAAPDLMENYPPTKHADFDST